VAHLQTALVKEHSHVVRVVSPTELMVLHTRITFLTSLHLNTHTNTNRYATERHEISNFNDTKICGFQTIGFSIAVLILLLIIIFLVARPANCDHVGHRYHIPVFSPWSSAVCTFLLSLPFRTHTNIVPNFHFYLAREGAIHNGWVELNKRSAFSGYSVTGLAE
jgi:hypothetical protein